MMKDVPAGEYDMEIVLLERYGLTPGQVDALDSDFFDELLAKLWAEGQSEVVNRKRQQMQAAMKAHGY